MILWKPVTIIELAELQRFVDKANSVIDNGGAKFNFNNSNFGDGYEAFAGRPLLQTGIVRVKAGDTLQIHIDGNFTISEWAVNIPLRDCQDSVTKFWHTDKAPVRRLHKDGAYWHVEGPYTLIDQFLEVANVTVCVRSSACDAYVVDVFQLRVAQWTPEMVRKFVYEATALHCLRSHAVGQ